jgi:hypothetical protein
MKLVGKWTKTSTGECDQQYPYELEFYENPRFLAKRGPGQGFIIWDTGRYEVLDSGRVQIHIATDQRVPYEFSLSDNDNVLTFVDRDGCEFTYQRIE